MNTQSRQNGLEWWGYKHTNGSTQVKRYFDAQDLVEARQSPFVDRVTGPFLAKNRDDAITITEARLP